MARTRINIDGITTRKQIGTLAGKMNGIDKLCKEAGLPSEALNMACLRGWTSPKVVNTYTKAGIPIIISAEPIPARCKVRHARSSKKEEGGEPVQLRLEITDGKEAIPTTKITEAGAIKDLLITHLTALIEDLKKI